jgi:hypothetical protein
MENQRIGLFIFSGIIFPLILSTIQLVNILTVVIYIAPQNTEYINEGCHYIYVCKKRPDADEKAKTHWDSVEKFLKNMEKEE